MELNKYLEELGWSQELISAVDAVAKQVDEAASEDSVVFDIQGIDDGTTDSSSLSLSADGTASSFLVIR